MGGRQAGARRARIWRATNHCLVSRSTSRLWGRLGKEVKKTLPRSRPNPSHAFYLPPALVRVIGEWCIKTSEERNEPLV